MEEQKTTTETDVKIKDKFAKLIDVKTIVTFMFAIITCYLAVVGSLETDKFYTLALMILTFYFGTQKAK